MLRCRSCTATLVFLQCGCHFYQSCAATSEKLQCNQHWKAASQESGAFLPLSRGLQAPTFRHPRLGPADEGGIGKCRFLSQNCDIFGESPSHLLSVATPAEPRGEKKLFFVQILGGEKLLKFGEKRRWNIFKRPERGYKFFKRVSDRFSDPFSRFSNRFLYRFKSFSGAVSFCTRAALISYAMTLVAQPLYSPLAL